jgi:hypothetical protein
VVAHRAVWDLPDEMVSSVEEVIAARRSEPRSAWRALNVQAVRGMDGEPAYTGKEPLEDDELAARHSSG